jgi:hypothetical protein
MRVKEVILEEPDAGTVIFEALHQLLKASIEYGCAVSTTFNGKPLRVDINEIVDAIAQQRLT